MSDAPALHCLAVIPTKALASGKSRLAGVLDQHQRALLVRTMLARVFSAVGQAGNIAGVMVAGPNRNGLPEHLPLVGSADGSLNADLAAALAAAGARNVGRLVIVAGDLPLVTALEIELLGAVAAGAIGIAPDRHGTGTNALSLPLPGARGFSFAFGTDSFARHSAEAARLGMPLEVIRSRGLASDIDEPDDLGDVADLLGLPC